MIDSCLFNIRRKLFEYLNGSWIYTLPSIVGILVYNAVALLGNNSIAPGIAWLNSIVSVVSLLNLAVFYVPSTTRRSFIENYSTKVLFFLYSIFLITILIFDSLPATVTLVVVIVLGKFSIDSLYRADQKTSLRIAVVTSLLTPLTCLAWLIADIYIVPLVLAINIVAIYLMYISAVFYTPSSTIKKEIISPLFSSVLMQSPYILFPIFELKVSGWLAESDYLHYAATWKTTNGVLVLLFAKIQFLIAFESHEISKLISKLPAILFSLLIVICYLLDNGVFVLILKLSLLSLLINISSSLVRIRLRIENRKFNFFAIFSFLIFLSSLIFSNGAILVFDYMRLDILSGYLIFAAISALYPLILVRS